MPKPETTPTLKNLDRRLANIEQILPTLATKDELRAAIDGAVAPLATRDEVRAEAVETRRHFDVVFESMRAEIRVFADGQVGLTERLDAFETKTERAIAHLDQRVLRLEADRRR